MDFSSPLRARCFLPRVGESDPEDGASSSSSSSSTEPEASEYVEKSKPRRFPSWSRPALPPPLPPLLPLLPLDFRVRLRVLCRVRTTPSSLLSSYSDSETSEAEPEPEAEAEPEAEPGADVSPRALLAARLLCFCFCFFFFVLRSACCLLGRVRTSPSEAS